MQKYFNVESYCIPEEHYMVNMDSRLKEIKQMVDAGKYFVINRGRQYGKTTTLNLLIETLGDDYAVIFMDFQSLSSASFQNEKIFSVGFMEQLELAVKTQKDLINALDEQNLRNVKKEIVRNDNFNLTVLFKYLVELCATAKKPVVLMIDEVDSATNNQVFLDFLAQLRNLYNSRKRISTFQSVILAGVYDVKNLKLKIRPETEHNKYNSPWNIAAEFDVRMSFSADDIEGMLNVYEKDHHTGMNTASVAKTIYDYTAGYPFLVSYICKLLDEKISCLEYCGKLSGVWNEDGIAEAVKIIIRSKIVLFDSMKHQIDIFPDLKEMLREVIYQGRKIPFSADNEAMEMGVMFGFLKKDEDFVTISNRIFEMRLMALFVSENHSTPAQLLGERMKPQFIVNGRLDMDKVMEKFVEYHGDIFAEKDEKYIESFGREIFLMFLKPIINGTGHYYLEAETRDMTRTDVVVDYLGEQFIIEMKLWHGKEYHERGEEQLCEYLNYYHKNKGYMLSFNFNKKKECGVKEIRLGDKTIVEAVV